MIRSIRRAYRRLQQDLRTLFNTRRNTQDDLTIAIFVVSGIVIFAALHTIFNMTLSTDSHQHTGHVDLYGENATSCWRSCFVNRQSSVMWPASIEISSKHNLHNSQQPLATKSIRNDIRIVHKWNATFWKSHKVTPRAGECFMESSSLGLFSSFRSQRFQCLPSFIIAGAMKSGTGELMKWLRFHPYLRLIENSRDDTRESHFFSRRQHFPTLSTISERYALFQNYSTCLPSFTLEDVSKVYNFEKSPDYIRSAHTLQLIQNSLPNIKLILILRNPVYRALSEFSHHCRHRRYVKLLESVAIKGISYPKGSIFRVEHERSFNPKKALSGIRQFVVEKSDLPANSYYRLSYPCSTNDMVNYFQPPTTSKQTALNSVESGGSVVADEIEHGFYERQLLRLFEIFKNHKDNVLILLQEDMYKNTYRTLRQVESFLGLPCFDYSQVAYISLDDNNNKNRPPIRRPRTVHERMRHYRKSIFNMFNLFGSSNNDEDRVSKGENLFKQAPKAFQSWLVDTFRSHNQALRQLLDKEILSKNALNKQHYQVDIKAAQWSL